MALALFTGACTSAPTGTQAKTPSPTFSAAQPTTALAPLHPVSLPALFGKTFDGRGLRLGRVLERAGAYTRYFVTYESGGLTISGILNIPSGAGPFPVLILNHGYIDPDVYTNGRGLAREQDYLARHGYVVLHTDYRNHAQSDDDPDADLHLRLGYTEDVVNAILAVKGSNLPALDRERIGVLGRSMGGGVTLNAAVVRPDLIDAIVLYAPVSSDAVDNFRRWIDGPEERRQLAQRIIAAYGSPDANPGFWRNISPVNFFDRIGVPIIVHHGTADESVPFEWSERTVAALQRLDKDARLLVYEGEHHAFGPQWGASIRRTVSFFDEILKR